VLKDYLKPCKTNPYNREIGKRESGVAELSGTEIWSDFTVVGSWMEKYKSAEALLKCGADPNIASTVDGMTPLYLAAGFSWIDNYAKKDPKFVKLLLKYNADPNITYGGNAIIEPGTSPLMNSIRCGIEKTKALVEAGAYINYKTKSGTTAAIKALLAGQNATLEALVFLLCHPRPQSL